MRLWTGLALCCCAALGSMGCTVGEGTGLVQSDRLYLKGCWDGQFDLGPDFFAANPYRGESLFIRIQRGDNNEESSDGVGIVVNDLAAVRERLDQPIPVGLPTGVTPPGVPPTGAPDPLVSISIYLHQTCHEQNSSTYAVNGNITFHKLFSGDLNEDNSDARLTEGSFDASFADPRELLGATDAAAVTSANVHGEFSFFFQRGQPAQPFQ